MSEQWKRPTPRWVQAVVLALVIVGIIAAFTFIEEPHDEPLADDSLRFFDGLEGNLAIAEVRSTQMTADQWARIAATPSLKKVALVDVEDFGEGMVQLTALPELRFLDIANCPTLRDEDIAWCCRELSLERLSVPACEGVTDASIAALIDAASLAKVDLMGTSVTAEGFLRLRESRRDMKIVMSSGVFDSTPSNVARGGLLVPTYTHGAEDYRTIGRLGKVLDTPKDVETLWTVLAVPHDWQTGEWTPDPAAQVEHLVLSGVLAASQLPRLASTLRHVRVLVLHRTRVVGDVGDWSDRLTDLVLNDLTEDSDLSDFSRCSSLTHVHYLNRDSDRCVPLGFLAGLPNLKSVDCGSERMTIENVEVFSRLKSLRDLQMYGATDATIGPLLHPDSVPQLERLAISVNAISPETLMWLQAAHPAAEIPAYIPW